jgi:hypothetical protein
MPAELGTFLATMPHIAAIDLFVVRPLTFAYSTPSSLFGWRGASWWIGGSASGSGLDSAAITEAFPGTRPGYLIRATRSTVLSPACAPWAFATSRSRPARRQNGFAER